MIKRKITLAIILLLALIIRIIFFQGTDGSDSLKNTRYAYDISKGAFPTDESQGNFRIGLFIPVSILYIVFGVNEFSSAILPLIMSLFGIVLIFLFGKLLFNEKIGLMAAFLLSIFPLDVLYATRLMSDLPSAVFSGLSIYLFLKAEKTDKKTGTSTKNYMLYALSGISLGISFSIREMAIVTLLFYLVYAIYNKKLKMSYGLIGVGFLSIFILELIFFYMHTGNPFIRFTSLSGHYTERAEFHNFYGRALFPKFFLTWPYVVFGNLQHGIFFTFISIAVIYWLFHRKKEINYLLIWFLSAVFFFYFGTTSFTRYEPILAVARYLSYISIPSLLLLAAFLTIEQKAIKKIILPFTMIFLFFTSVLALHLDESRHSLDNLREAYSYIKSADKPVYADRRSIMAVNYTSGYNNKLNLTDLDSIKNFKNIEDAYVLINNQFIKGLIEANHELKFPKRLKEIPGNWVEVKVIGESDKNITIYSAK